MEGSFGGDRRVLTYKGKSQSMIQWAEELGVSVYTLRSRLDILEWSVDKALSTSARKKVRKKAA
jgi:uncharacterized protein YjcR